MNSSFLLLLSSRSASARFRSVMSRAIFEAPVIWPDLPRTGEIGSEIALEALLGERAGVA